MQINDHVEIVKDDVRYWWAGGIAWRVLSVTALLYVIALIVLAFYWSREPKQFDVVENATTYAEGRALVSGVVSTAAMIEVAKTLLEKPGGFLSNDVAPPSVALDNIPNWEFGVLVQVRDLASAMRENFSRSQTQSTEDGDLAIAEPRFNFDNDSWIFPRSEDEYREGIRRTESYLRRLGDNQQAESQFFTRADNLAVWLATVESRLGSLSQRLSASVGQRRLNTDLAGDAEAKQATETAKELIVKTPWLEIDDVFYESRGTCWALIHFLRAIEIDFEDVLEKKNAAISLQQIIRELESTQESLWPSPMVLNGSGFGVFANHSLVMASYISRANAGIIDLRELLTKG